MIEGIVIFIWLFKIFDKLWIDLVVMFKIIILSSTELWGSYVFTKKFPPSSQLDNFTTYVALHFKITYHWHIYTFFSLYYAMKTPYNNWINEYKFIVTHFSSAQQIMYSSERK